MGLFEKALADLMTTQHETSEKVKALAVSLEASTRSLEETAASTRKTAELANVLVGQLDRNAEATAELIKHLGGIAQSQAELAARVTRLEERLEAS